MKKTTTLLTATALATFAFVSLNSSPTANIQSHVDIVEFSANPPTGKTGAPGEGNCIDCHGGQVLSAAGTVTFEFNTAGTSTDYIPGQTYDMSIGVASGAKNGFQLTILNSSNQKAGDFINGTNTSTASAGGKEYIRQSASNGITTYDFQWTAPATDMGDLRAYYNFNVSNNNGNTIGDMIYAGDQVIPTSVTASVGSFDENPNDITAFFDANSRQINLDYNLTEPSSVMVNVQSLSGQLIQTTSLGTQNKGKHKQLLAVNDMPAGIYIVSVFVNNRVFNHKLLMQ